jgi:hypothetical protein
VDRFTTQPFTRERAERRAMTRIAYPPTVRRMTPPRILASRAGTARYAALVAFGVLVAHDAVYSAQEAMGSTNAAVAEVTHRYWPSFVALALLAMAVAASWTAVGFLRLRHAIRRLPAPPQAPKRTERTYLAELTHLWPRLLLGVGLAFLLQENVEHLVSGRHLPGLWVLSGPEYPLVIPVLTAVTGLLAAFGAWFRQRIAVMVWRLRAARVALALRAHHRAAPSLRYRLVAAILAHRWILLRPDIGRAPPASA